MGGLEQVTYDSKEKILYGISEAGFITLIDYINGIEQPPQLDIVLTGEGKTIYTDVFVCSEQGVLFASFKDDPNRGNIAVYKAAQPPGTLTMSLSSLLSFSTRWK